MEYLIGLFKTVDLNPNLSLTKDPKEVLVLLVSNIIIYEYVALMVLHIYCIK